ncbi:MAG: thiamine-phosphate pyrophosphorylase [Fibrobacter sp.]|nr:thiamine-phosphate pyrophosphorylase [Fibrobacter sp.]
MERNLPNGQISVYRVLDANLNRLREALRVIEEYYRFYLNDELISITFKTLRHSLIILEEGFGRKNLLANRDTQTDCFADVNRPEELQRTSHEDIVVASFKRAQEASRVIEEYSKVTEHVELSEVAKKVRFSLYSVEKQILG